MRKEILATLLISIYWIIAGFFVAYSAWDHAYMIAVPAWQSNLLDPYALGAALALAGLFFTFILLRIMLPSRTTQRRKLIQLLDEVGIDEIDTLQRKLNTLREDDSLNESDRVVPLESLLREHKRKNESE